MGFPFPNRTFRISFGRRFIRLTARACKRTRHSRLIPDPADSIDFAFAEACGSSFCCFHCLILSNGCFPFSACVGFSQSVGYRNGVALSRTESDEDRLRMTKSPLEHVSPVYKLHGDSEIYVGRFAEQRFKKMKRAEEKKTPSPLQNIGLLFRCRLLFYKILLFFSPLK